MILFFSRILITVIYNEKTNSMNKFKVLGYKHEKNDRKTWPSIKSSLEWEFTALQWLMVNKDRPASKINKMN